MKYLLTVSVILIVISCKKTTQDTTFDTDKKIDSLEMAAHEKEWQMNSLVVALIEIDNNLQKIKEKENLITMNVTDNETKGQALEDRINRDIKVIYELMVKNKEQITQLEKQLSQTSSNKTNLDKLIKRLNNQLKDKTVEIIEIQEQLKNQDLEITDLNFTIEGLQHIVDSLQNAKQATQQQLDETITKLYRAHYAFGTKKELKAENILTSDGILSKNKILTEEYSKEYFTTIDIREIDSIPLYMPKARVLTNHPRSSYILETNDDGKLVLRITDKEKFWSHTKYLVVQVN